MRLIDADELLRKHKYDIRNWGKPYGVENKHIEQAPTIDAVPVVRCKDCEYYENGECVNPYIWMSDGAHFWPDEDFYCANGERRSNT